MGPVAFLLLAAVAAAAVPGERLTVSPPRATLLLPAGVDTVLAFRISGARGRVEVTTADWTLDPDGSLRLLPAGSGPRGCGDWLALPAGGRDAAAAGETTVRVRLRTPPSDGGVRWGALVLAETVPDTPEDLPVLSREAIVPVVVDVAGPGRPGLEISALASRTDGRGVVVRLENPGDRILAATGSIELRDGGGAVVASLPLGPPVVLLPGLPRDVVVDVPAVPAGVYAVSARLEGAGRVRRAEADLHLR